jgi:hypothetical protein
MQKQISYFWVFPLIALIALIGVEPGYGDSNESLVQRQMDDLSDRRAVEHIFSLASKRLKTFAPAGKFEGIERGTIEIWIYPNKEKSFRMPAKLPYQGPNPSSTSHLTNVPPYDNQGRKWSQAMFDVFAWNSFFQMREATCIKSSTGNKQFDGIAWYCLREALKEQILTTNLKASDQLRCTAKFSPALGFTDIELEEVHPL